jgi:hypothetical protein
MTEIEKVYEKVKDLKSENIFNNRGELEFTMGQVLSKDDSPFNELTKEYLHMSFMEEPYGNNEWKYQVDVKWYDGRIIFCHITNEGKTKTFCIKMDDLGVDCEDYNTGITTFIKKLLVWNSNIYSVYNEAWSWANHPYPMFREDYEQMLEFLK